jgi:hypothetical protein
MNHDKLKVLFNKPVAFDLPIGAASLSRIQDRQAFLKLVIPHRRACARLSDNQHAPKTWNETRRYEYHC